MNLGFSWEMMNKYCILNSYKAIFNAQTDDKNRLGEVSHNR